MPTTIPALARDLQPALQHKLDRKTKPMGSLGRLEALALQLGLIQQRLDPQIVQPTMLVFAGDHGLARAGVSPFPPEVTPQMVLNFLSGGAAVNVLCRANGLDFKVVNAGVNYKFAPHPLLIDVPLAHGTASSLDGPAMTREQAELALQRGADIVAGLAAQGCTVLALGEMGIGNTSAASLLMAQLTDVPLADCTGRGTGHDDDGLARKLAVLQQVQARHASLSAPLDILAAVGGFEIAMMAGAYLAGAASGMLLLVDGFIATAALLVASRINPAVLDYCAYAHCSGEQGHRRLLAELSGEPLLDLGLRLGEGSGAATAFPLLRAAAAILNEMASFESAGVSDKDG
ncbi:nicotinate-nucleotide-dimethylbenzimidazole phosphoribosyltransferase [Andreprevotia lacus DSM 23236]|jgi:nicotinate-nucleotide--dimethylbenzimidazole phosphoribosyltransferase|uniref:Nicotinate-nucleotide--dimethylbenzimidazole phosphoribosyltransferase n=1 Tax=Andreprevotia lacus DSM 23236 TaxID=1121001 RepID=A0A1W1XRJ9_9NEIS|nr:nicotinate-nucleotide--dimethylbenzimidazole phosphoribosyltransferase [Andreprevotia lacus]SMC26583.1 nicotinate-nucleotide-dimethylbenzimidazole phosphoribosyltransferase [Andreprevotia lacus DSM 23236]